MFFTAFVLFILRLFKIQNIRPNNKQKSSSSIYLSFEEYDEAAFRDDMSTGRWSVIDIFDDVDDKLNAFNLIFDDILDSHAPIKEVKIRGRPNPCVTKEIRTLMKTRDYGESWRGKQTTH